VGAADSGEASGLKAAASPDELSGSAASDGWQRYLRVWHAHRRDPSDPFIRRFLRLPAEEALAVRSRRGRSAPRQLRWRPGSYSQVETPHFQIFSRADTEQTRRIAEDLERCYWIWTQYFFPLWKGSDQVAGALRGLSPQVPVGEFLRRRPARVTIRQKLRIVLFGTADAYRRTLAESVPGIERSTGYYSDGLRLAFFYVAEPDDAATRRHELVHQMFREATDSGLGRDKPGESSDFWLVEGVAGYFESLWMGGSYATLGGWDAPRLQYARHRVVVGGDTMTLEELRPDGRLKAQRRSDLARWYTHAITHVHRLLDAGTPGHRNWVLARLASLYRIREASETLESAATPPAGNPSELKRFLLIDDRHLMNHPTARPITDLCLAGCRVTGAGLETLPETARFRWLNLSRLPISDEDVTSLVDRPGDLEQLSLEATRVSDRIAPLIGRATRLRELDLSWTAIGDPVVQRLRGARELETLWLTGTTVGDDSIAPLEELPNLKAVDLQRTAVSERAVQRLKSARPELNVNPLQLRAH
jgi:hypothetical protein